MKSDTPLPCRNHQACAIQHKVKTRHNIRKGPTTSRRSREPTGAKTIIRQLINKHLVNQFAYVFCEWGNIESTVSAVMIFYSF